MLASFAAGAEPGLLDAAALLLVKSTLLLGAAALAARGLRRASAASRHLLWSLTLGALLALPALAVALPDWRPGFLAVVEVRPEPSPAAAAPPARPAGDVRFASLDAMVPPLPEAPAAPSPRTGNGVPLAAVLLGTWAAGAAAVLARLALGLARVRRLARAAQPVRDYAWTWLADRMRPAVGLDRPVALLRSRGASMPMTWGILRPVVLLPADADAWSPERRRIVLLHELAHVARGDCLTQVLAEVACAVWWFHPGAWWAARRMRLEREQACDDRVLEAGARASDYAAHLLDVARAYRAPALAAAAIAMARPSHLEGRVRAVLDAGRDRRAPTLRTGAVCGGAVLLAVLPVATAAPSAREADDAPARRVSMVVPVSAEVGPSGRGTGKATATTRINGVDVRLDFDVRVTLVPGDRANDAEVWRAPAFATPERLPAFVSAPGVEGGAPVVGRLYVEEDGGRVRIRPAVPRSGVRGEEPPVPVFTFDVEPEIRTWMMGALARLAASGDARGAAVVPPPVDGKDECPEKREAREAIRGQMAEALRQARQENPEAVRFASRFVDLDQVADLLSDAMAQEIAEGGE